MNEWILNSSTLSWGFFFWSISRNVVKGSWDTFTFTLCRSKLARSRDRFTLNEDQVRKNITILLLLFVLCSWYNNRIKGAAGAEYSQWDLKTPPLCRRHSAIPRYVSWSQNDSFEEVALFGDHSSSILVQVAPFQTEVKQWNMGWISTWEEEDGDKSEDISQLDGKKWGQVERNRTGRHVGIKTIVCNNWIINCSVTPMSRKLVERVTLLLWLSNIIQVVNATI